jgi:hypothetical protein
MDRHRPVGGQAGTRKKVGARSRTRIIAALHELVTFAEGLLSVNGKLLEALGGETPPSPDAVADARRHHERWVEQLAGFRKRLAGLMIEPPERVQ